MTIQPIYLDYNATTPVDPRVLEKMLPFFSEQFGNPASLLSEWGWNADRAVQIAAKQVAEFLGAKPHEIFFTSGATESNNWALWGLLEKHRQENPGTPFHVLTSAVEHNSILNALRALEPWGIEYDILPVDSEGHLHPSTVLKALRPNTCLISAIWVNNEIGTINDIEALGKLAHDNKIYFHTDATQALGKVPIHLQNLPVDLLSFSGHKIYGPKGVGGLYIRSQSPAVVLAPLLSGGGQQKGLRSGTLNVPGIVGLGESCAILNQEGAAESQRIENLRNLLWMELQKQKIPVRLHGPTTKRACNNLNLGFPGHRIELILPRLKRLGFSTGAACGTAKMSLSHVLKAIGLSETEIFSSLRISLGRETTETEIHKVVQILREAFVSDCENP